MNRLAAHPPTTHRPSEERTGCAIRRPSTRNPSSTPADHAATTLSGTGRSSSSPQRQARRPAHTTGRGSTSATPNAERTCGGSAPADGRTGTALTRGTVPAPCAGTRPPRGPLSRWVVSRRDPLTPNVAGGRDRRAQPSFEDRPPPAGATFCASASGAGRFSERLALALDGSAAGSAPLAAGGCGGVGFAARACDDSATPLPVGFAFSTEPAPAFGPTGF